MTTPTTTTETDLEAVLEAAARAAAPFAAVPPRERAAALVRVAEALEAAAPELIAIGRRETGLTEPRLTAEVARTALQLRMFAATVLDGAHLDARLDAADPGFVLGPRPDLRRCLVPVGPVVNFAASNFPFAFSVAGGDTAAALAAGCPVIVKAHSGHPELSVRTAEVVSGALADAGMPDGIFALVSGQRNGVAALTDPRVAAGSFTGSLAAGRMLADLAAGRPDPIPFFGELGSVNPVFATAAGLDRDRDGFVAGYVASVSGSAGQLCTKPGLVFVPAGHGLDAALAAQAATVAEHRLLNPRIAAAYAERRDAVLATPGVRTVAAGALLTDDDGQGWATPTIAAVPLETLRQAGPALRDEVFGPFSLLVEYAPGTDLAGLARELFAGSLTMTLHLGEDETGQEAAALLAAATGLAGRVLAGGWPTGVAVTPAMQHGGPWPATTNDSGTSVGSAAIARFLRPVAYQGVPDALLPPPLRDANPWGVPRRVSPAGESARWGR